MKTDEAKNIMTEIDKVKFDNASFGEEVNNVVSVNDVRKILYLLIEDVNGCSAKDNVT